MALPGRDLLDLLARVARDPIAAGRNNDAIQRFDNSALGQRFGQHADWLLGGDDGMSLVDALLLAPKAAAGTAGMALEGTRTGARIGTGTILTGIGDAAKPIGPDEQVGLRELLVRNMAHAVAQQLHIDQPAKAASEGFEEQRAAGGGVLGAGLAANEAAAGKNRFLTGGLNELLDVSNLLPGPETLLFDGIKAARGAKIAERLLAGVPEAGARGAAEEAARIAANPPPLGVPGVANNPGFRKALELAIEDAGPVAPVAREGLLEAPARRVVDLAAEAAPATASYDDFLGLAREIPGELPPPSSKFWDRLGADPEAVRGFFDQAHREGVMGTTDAGLSALRPVEEFPQAADRAAGLASLTPDEVRQLAKIAYPSDNAIKNAAKKYPTTAELADAALARIGGSRDALEYIASSNPPLAKKLAYMPGIAHVWPHALATTVGGAGLGGLAGATAGAGAGFMQGDGDFLDRVANAGEGALTGMTIGMGIGGLGGATIGKNTSAQAAADIMRHGVEQGKAGTKLALAGGTKGAPGGATEFVRGGFRYWAGQVVRHPKNLFNDELWNEIVTSALSPKTKEFLRGMRESIAARAGLDNSWDRLPQGTQDILALRGIDKDAYLAAEKLHGKGQGLAALDLGIPLEKGVEDRAHGMAKEMIYSTLTSALNPQGFANNLLGLIAGGPAKGALNTAWRPFFNAVNGILNNTFRHAAYAQEFAEKTLLGRQALIDAGYTAFKALPESGVISADEVARTLGTREGAVWKAMLDNAHDLAQQRVKFLFGNYGDKKGWERGFGTVIPFASWAIRAYPVALEMAAEHPLIALGLYRATEALSQGAGEDGRPGYTAGMIPIPDKAGLLTGGQGSTAYLDLIGGISPVGGDMFAPADKGQQPENTYQEISQGLQKLGLPGPNPLVQSLAYIMGFDYKSPGALSRTQGVENALGLLPGNPALPDIGGGGLRKARSVISPLVAGTDIGALLGAEADVSPSQYDPIGRRFDELVVARTGKRLDDPANKAYLLDLAFGRGDLYEQAERETLLGGAARNIASMSSPVGVATQTEDNRRARAATDKVPFDYGDIAALPQGTPERRQAEQARKAGLAADPWAEPYGIGGRQEAQDELMRIIMDRYRKAGTRPTQAGIQEQIRLMEAAAERQRITHP